MLGLPSQEVLIIKGDTRYTVHVFPVISNGGPMQHVVLGVAFRCSI